MKEMYKGFYEEKWGKLIRDEERKQTLEEVLDYCEKEEEANKECADTGDKFCEGYITGLQYVEQYLEKEIKKLEYRKWPCKEHLEDYLKKMKRLGDV